MLVNLPLKVRREFSREHGTLHEVRAHTFDTPPEPMFLPVLDRNEAMEAKYQFALEQRGTMVIARVDCGVTFVAHITPGAVRALELTAGRRVWLVLKTHSCHLVD